MKLRDGGSLRHRFGAVRSPSDHAMELLARLNEADRLQDSSVRMLLVSAMVVGHVAGILLARAPAVQLPIPAVLVALTVTGLSLLLSVLRSRLEIACRRLAVAVERVGYGCC